MSPSISHSDTPFLNVMLIVTHECAARRGDAMVAFAEGLQAADERYIATAEEKKDAVLMCCGTCAVAAYGAHRPSNSPQPAQASTHSPQ